jgi:hypothetical protein
MSVTHEDLTGLSRAQKLALLARLARQKARAGATFPLSFQQQRMWFLDRLDPGNPANNIFRALTFDGRLDVPALARALTAIVHRHEALRTTFPMVGDAPRQRVAPLSDLPLPLVDVSGLPAALRPDLATRLAAAESRRAFDLARGPLFCAVLVRQAPERH